jgi:hypothetical protein
VGGLPSFRALSINEDLSNNFKNSFGLTQDIVIPKAKHLNTLLLDVSSSPFVIEKLSVLVVLTAINLDRQLCFVAIKINDIWTDWVLTPELEATHPSVPQAWPKSIFSIGGMMS